MSEEMVQIPLTKKEAEMIILLRKYSYGKFTIHKYDGDIKRLEVMESHLITGDLKKMV